MTETLQFLDMTGEIEASMIADNIPNIETTSFLVKIGEGKQRVLQL